MQRLDKAVLPLPINTCSICFEKMHRGSKPYLLPEGSPNGLVSLGGSVVAHHGIQSQRLEGSLSSKSS